MSWDGSAKFSVRSGSETAVKHGELLKQPRQGRSGVHASICPSHEGWISLYILFAAIYTELFNKVPYSYVQQSTVQLCSTKYRTVMWPRRQSAHEVRNFNLNIKWSLLLAPRSGRLTPGKNQSVTHNRSRNIRKECFQLPSILKAAASCQNCTIGNRLEFGAVRREGVVI